MPPSQQIPSSPIEAIRLMRNELNALENQPWVKGYQGGGRMSAETAVAPNQTAQSIQTIAMGFGSLAAFAVETAGQRT